MSQLRVVNYKEPSAFLGAMEKYDNSFMNVVLGNLHDSIRNSKGCADVSHASASMWAVYKKDTLIVSLAKPSGTYPWLLCTPWSEIEMPITDIFNAVQLLCVSLLSVVSPVLGNFIGPDGAGKAFLDSWLAAWSARGTHLRIVGRGPPVKVGYATLASLLPPSNTTPNGSISLATLENLESILPLHLAFARGSPLSVASTADAAFAVLRPSIMHGLTWLYRVEGEFVGYLVLGRETTKTISIRNVYVSPEHRRKGIAEAMVRAIIRLYLGAHPSGFEGGLENLSVQTKQEVNLNVLDLSPERLHQEKPESLMRAIQTYFMSD